MFACCADRFPVVIDTETANAHKTNIQRLNDRATSTSLGVQNPLKTIKPIALSQAVVAAMMRSLGEKKLAEVRLKLGQLFSARIFQKKDVRHDPAGTLNRRINTRSEHKLARLSHFLLPFRRA